MKKIKAGVIGVGHLGKHHTRIYNELANLVGVYDKEQDRAEEIAKQFNCSHYKDFHSLIEKADVISLATPASTHFQIAEEVIKAGKHLLVEKPITVEVHHADKLIELAKDKNIILQVGHSERFNPAFRQVKDIIKNPFFIESHRIGFPSERGLDVAVVLDLMIHDIDIVLMYIQSPVKSISAIGAPILSNEIDIANARIEFENGSIANFMVSRAAQKSKRKIRFFQSDAYISVDSQKGKVEIYRRSYQNGKGEIIVENIDNCEGEPLMLEIDSFLQAVKNNDKPEVTGEDGRNALDISWKIVDKIRGRFNLILKNNEKNPDNSRRDLR